jgi:hypothetical protein
MNQAAPVRVSLTKAAIQQLRFSGCRGPFVSKLPSTIWRVSRDIRGVFIIDENRVRRRQWTRWKPLHPLHDEGAPDRDVF